MTTRTGGPGIVAALAGFDPTDEQWAAIEHPLEPLHLIAGAGSGKTAIMAARMVWAVERRGYEPSQLLGLTFTNKAAQELAERVAAALAALGRPVSGVAGGPTVQTYHAFAAAIVRDHGLLVGVESEAALLTQAQQWQLVLSCLDRMPAFEAIELRSSGGIARAAIKLASSLADHIVATSDVEAAADLALSSASGVNDDIVAAAVRRKELCRVVAAYQEAKAAKGRIDFGDQVTKAVEVLETQEIIRDRYRQRWPVVLLDEYQDTNVAQRRLMQALVGRGGAVTAVGDTRQAIYAFRGATMYNLIDFPTHFPRLSGAAYDEVSLSENFRSGARILAVANHVVERIPVGRRPGKPLRARPENGAGRVSLGLFSDDRAEADWIASRCEDVHGRRLMPNRPPVRWRDIAILVRRRSSMGAVLEALERRDVPVEVVGLAGLLKTPEVIEVVAWLRCLDNRPAANRWMAKVLLGPRWRIHYRDLALCARWAAHRNHALRLRLAGGDEERARDIEPGDVGFSLLEALDHLDEIDGLGDEARRRLGEFAECLADLRRSASAPLLELVREVVEHSGIADALAASGSRRAAAGRQNLASLLDHVADFAPIEGEATLKSLLAYLDAAEEAEETLEASQPAEADSVKLMTVHTAKGLEFECVFVPAVAASTNAKGEHVYSVFPDERTSNPLTSYAELPYEVREDAAQLPSFEGNLTAFSAAVKERVREDERRLFYVALTRAKQHLAVTAAWWYGRERRVKGPSDFWDDLAELESTGLVDVVARAEELAENPSLEALRLGTWPPASRPNVQDPLFENGWGAAAEHAFSAPDALEALVSRLDETERAEYTSLLEGHVDDLELISRAAGAHAAAEELPDILSATDFVGLEAFRLDPIELTRPLPEPPSTSRALGIEVHRLIEERLRAGQKAGAGAPAFAEESELDEPLGSGARAQLGGLLQTFDRLGYGHRRVARLPSGELMLELPFALRVDSRIVRGRIDAVFETDDGGIELVDFKTGGRFEPGTPDQLEIYAAALEANGLLPAGAPVLLTYAWLDGGAPLTRRFR